MRSHSSATASCSVIAVLSVLVPCAGLAQTQARHSPSTQKAAPAPTELDKRLAAARAARDSGDPAAAQLANERLIAVALSELARLRMAATGVSPGRRTLRQFPPFRRCSRHAPRSRDRRDTSRQIRGCNQAGKASPCGKSERPSRSSGARKRAHTERGLRTGRRALHTDRTCSAER